MTFSMVDSLSQSCPFPCRPENALRDQMVLVLNDTQWAAFYDVWINTFHNCAEAMIRYLVAEGVEFQCPLCGGLGIRQRWELLNGVHETLIDDVCVCKERITKRMNYVTKVAGVTFPNEDGSSRQEILSRVTLATPCKLIPEPTNKYDPLAVAVFVAIESGKVEQVGYLPKNLSAIVAPQLEGESVMVRIVEIVGGFETSWGDTASLGLRIVIDTPEQAEA